MMTAIWGQDEGRWRLLTPTGFPDEKTLHTLVEQAPHMLPLAGAPQLIVVGREVQIGSGYADLIAIEPAGRLVIIEIKLERSAEARRAIVAQVLTYAAYLQNLDVPTLEQVTLNRHLRERGYSDLANAVASNDQEGGFDSTVFSEEIRESLRQGQFRLVLVLDEAPEELARLVGYLESVTDKLLIDLITVSAYEVGGVQILVPQRVTAEPRPSDSSSLEAKTPSAKGFYTEGPEAFRASIDEAPQTIRHSLQLMLAWAIKLDSENFARLGTYHGKSGRFTLLPYLKTESAGLVTIYNDKSEQGAYLALNRSVFERRAPNSLPHIEQLIGARIGRGTTTRNVTPELLDALTNAYREAAL